MPLTLTIRNADVLDNGSPTSLILDNRGAIIGRAQTTDWCLPDPSLHISSRHCEIQCRDGGYTLIDISTNGTFLLGQGARLPGPHLIQPGDVFLIGHYEIAAALDAQTASAMSARNAAPPPPQWKGWQADTPAAAPSSSNWDAVPTGSAISGTGPMSQSWAPPAVEATPPPAASGWGTPEPAASSWTAAPPPPPPASGWSSAIPDAAQAAAPSANDVWGKFNDSNVVDWARGGFGQPPAAPPAGFGQATPAPSADASLGLEQAPSFGALPHQPVAPAPAPAPVAPVHAAPPPPTAVQAVSGLPLLLAALGLPADQIKQGDAEAMTQAGDILRRVIAGLVVMLEARARAKSQMGAQGTSLEFDGNNPLKFARTPEQALVQMLNPPERGFMAADRAIEDAFRDLQAHQMATLKAMQGALRATLDRFSPTAIRSRATQTGLMAKILPGAKDAALWQAYEKEFSGVAQGSDEAFMDVFAKEFRKAYEEAARSR